MAKRTRATQVLLGLYLHTREPHILAPSAPEKVRFQAMKRALRKEGLWEMRSLYSGNHLGCLRESQPGPEPQAVTTLCLPLG